MLLHPITIDDREKLPSPSERVRELATLDVPAKVGRIPSGEGDYRWVCEPEHGERPWLVVNVERKSIADLMASANDGRLSNYIDATFPGQLRALLVEGDQFKFKSRGRPWTPEQLDNLLASVQMRGVMVIRAKSDQTTALRLKDFWKWTGKDEHGSVVQVARPQVSTNYLDEDTKAAVRFLMCLPGWGEKRARAALAKFGSLFELLAAVEAQDYEAFESVEGVSQGLVNKARKFLQ